MSYVLSFRMVFFYLVTTGWILDISLCENSINQSIGTSDRYYCIIADDMYVCIELQYVRSPLTYSRVIWINRVSLPNLFMVS